MFSLEFSIQIAMFASDRRTRHHRRSTGRHSSGGSTHRISPGRFGGAAGGLHGFVYGAVLLVVVLTLPAGIVGRFGGVLAKFVNRLPGARPIEDPEVTSDFTPVVTPAAAGQPILTANNIVKRFGGLAATDNVTLALHKGEILGLIGPNGAGKTTIFNLLSGFLTPDSGTVEVVNESGQTVSPKAPHGFANAGIGRTFQIVQPFGRLTVLENIMIGAFHKYRSASEARLKALKVARQVRLYEDRHTVASKLTVGGSEASRGRPGPGHGAADSAAG